jgi:hypothetical protein
MGKHEFAAADGPFRLDFHETFDTCGVVAETAPYPVFWFCGQSAHNGIPVHIAQLFNTLPVGPDVEVIVTGVPKRLGVAQGECAGY